MQCESDHSSTARASIAGSTAGLPTRGPGENRGSVVERGMQLSLIAASGLALVLAFTSPATAQFSTDAAANLVVAGEAYEEAQPKVVVTADGGFYVSWFANDPGGSPAGGYDVRLQRFNSFGLAEWPAGGILVADRGFSSTQDYGLATDGQGNALLAFRDDRSGSTQVTASLITPGSFQAWGPTGVQLTNTGDFIAAPKIAGATDGHTYVAWTQGSSVRLQRLDATGAATWANDIVLTPPAGSYSLADMQASDNGAAIFSWVAQAGGFTSPRHLYANKVSPAGAPLWGAGHVQVFDGGSLQFGNFPGFVPDDAGGACFGWYSSSPSLEAFAQRVDAAGNELFPHNGVSASTDPTQVRVSPAIAFDPTEGAVVLAYTELNAAQSQSGLSAQKFGPTGSRLWGPTGVQPVPIGLTQVGDVGVASLHVGQVQGAALTYTSSAGFGQDQLFAVRLDDAGAALGSPDALSTTPASKFRNTTTATPQGNVLTVWQDDASGSADIAVQNLLPKGALGGAPAVTPLLGSGLNPAALTAAVGPRLGQSWFVALDKASDPTALLSAVFIYGKALPAPALLPEGELLVDVTSPLVAQSIKTSGLTIDAHPFPVPAVIAYVGITVHAQGAILGVTSTTLTNGLSATVGL